MLRPPHDPGVRTLKCTGVCSRGPRLPRRSGRQRAWQAVAVRPRSLAQTWCIASIALLLAGCASSSRTNATGPPALSAPEHSVPCPGPDFDLQVFLRPNVSDDEMTLFTRRLHTPTDDGRPGTMFIEGVQWQVSDYFGRAVTIGFARNATQAQVDAVIRVLDESGALDRIECHNRANR